MRIILAPIAVSLLLGFSFKSMADDPQNTPDVKQSPQNTVAVDPQNDDTPTGIPLAEIQRFSEVFDRIKKAYVEPVSDKKLLEDAVRGMLQGLDPHSSYLAKDDFSELQIQTSGQFGGVGVEVSQEGGVIRVITPIDGTPAKKAGIMPGDIIIKIDGEVIQSIGVDKAISLMRGEIGSSIVLTIGREGKHVPFDVTLKRDLISVGSVTHRILDENFGYVRISQFQQQTGADLQSALAKMQEDRSLQGVVLDLRNNPGGLLTAAVAVTDAFIDKGVIVSTKGRLGSSDESYRATDKLAVGDIPVVVLINGGSASASEIVAGALQDTKRAVILGSTSFGKGSVQTILQLTGERAIKLTTAKYYTSNGRSIQEHGITPDVIVQQAKVTPAVEIQSVKEKNLAGHFTNDDQAQEPVLESHLLETDFQLHEAVSLLKGLAVYATRDLANADSE